MAEAIHSNPAFASQAAFRAVLDTMARPGTIHRIATESPPFPLSAGAAAVALALCDHDTPVWLGATLRVAPVIDWLRFHCGSPIVDTPCDAAFAFVQSASDLRLADFNIGTPDYPDRSTTIVMQVASLNSGAGLTLTGPGIPDRRALCVEPQPDNFSSQLAANRAHFPCGVDLLLIAGNEMAALPRSVLLINEDK